MIVTVSLDEIKKIVANQLVKAGMQVSAESASFKTRIEGDYDERVEVVEGLNFVVGMPTGWETAE